MCEFYGVGFNNRGFARCPFHREKTASFSIKGDLAHCFGCGWSGDVIAFVMELFNEPFVKAVERLNRDFALGLPIGEKLTIRQRTEMAKGRREMAAQRSERERRETEYRLRYDMLWDLWCYYDNVRRDYYPKIPGEEIDPRYADAVKNIDYINYRINSEL